MANNWCINDTKSPAEQGKYLAWSYLWGFRTKEECPLKKHFVFIWMSNNELNILIQINEAKK